MKGEEEEEEELINPLTFGNPPSLQGLAGYINGRDEIAALIRVLRSKERHLALLREVVMGGERGKGREGKEGEER